MVTSQRSSPTTNPRAKARPAAFCGRNRQKLHATFALREQYTAITVVSRVRKVADA
jgi:hypothetical protein